MKSYLNRITRNVAFLASILLTAGFVTSYSPRASAIPVDTSGTTMSGLWNIDAESGWGASVVHQYGIMFITIYTFDANRNPVWYAATNCVVANDRCRDAGMLKITNGEAVTTAWTGNRAIVPVGSLEMVFNTVNSATMNFVIDGRAGSKTVTRSQFANPPTPPPATGGFPFVFQGTNVQSLVFKDDPLGITPACSATLTATNITSTPNSISLWFDVVVNNLVTGSANFRAESLRPGLSFQSTSRILGNSNFLPCGQFTLQFNEVASRVFVGG